MAKVIWTLKGIRSLEAIHDYISKDSPTYAHRVVVGLHKKIRLLRNQIRLGQRVESIEDSEVREILYGHFRIAYRIVNENRVEILGVFHAAMDSDRYLS